MIKLTPALIKECADWIDVKMTEKQVSAFYRKFDPGHTIENAAWDCICNAIAAERKNNGHDRWQSPYGGPQCGE